MDIFYAVIYVIFIWTSTLGPSCTCSSRLEAVRPANLITQHEVTEWKRRHDPLKMNSNVQLIMHVYLLGITNPIINRILCASWYELRCPPCWRRITQHFRFTTSVENIQIISPEHWWENYWSLLEQTWYKAFHILIHTSTQWSLVTKWSLFLSCLS
jgi:hypothetical protein